jgi:hypothetical protein
MGRSASVARRVSGSYTQFVRLPFNSFFIFLYQFVGVDDGRNATEQETRPWGFQVGQHATVFRMSQNLLMESVDPYRRLGKVRHGPRHTKDARVRGPLVKKGPEL